MIAQEKQVKKKGIQGLEWCFSKGLLGVLTHIGWCGKLQWLFAEWLSAPQTFAFSLPPPPLRTTPAQGHVSNTLACSKTGSCPTPISVVILHLDIRHLCIPFSMLIFYRLLDPWFAIMDWSQAGNGNIAFQRPTATYPGLPEGLYLHCITELELRKHTLNGLIYIQINICPSSHTTLRLHSPSCGASTSGRPPQSNHLSEGWCWVTCFAASYCEL